MNKQQETIISQAADNYANSIAQSDERKKYCACDFMAGADFALNNQWIPVQGELPKDEIICTNGLAYGIGKINEDMDCDCDNGVLICGVTHWMPIPTLTIIEDAEFENQQQ